MQQSWCVSRQRFAQSELWIWFWQHRPSLDWAAHRGSALLTQLYRTALAAPAYARGGSSSESAPSSQRPTELETWFGLVWFGGINCCCCCLKVSSNFHVFEHLTVCTGMTTVPDGKGGVYWYEGGVYVRVWWWCVCTGMMVVCMYGYDGGVYWYD